MGARWEIFKITVLQTHKWADDPPDPPRGLFTGNEGPRNERPTEADEPKMFLGLF